MINVKLNREEFAYDIHSLVKAFYPAEDVNVCALEQTREHRSGREEQPVILLISILFDEEGIESRMTQPDGSELLCERVTADGLADRKTARNVLKTLLYRQLVHITGKQLPWGNLTGIRPTKIPMDLLEEGWKEEDIPAYMQEHYFVSAKKADLALRTASREKKILDRIPYRDGYSLYIGIPFCPSICLYCSFSSSPLAVWKDRVDDYLSALIREIGESAHLFDGYALQSIYIGGGTPTTLEPRQMDRLLCAVERFFDRDQVLEFTVEAGRPDTITADKLKVLRDHGISRISINPQTMNQKTLDVIGRRHTVDEIREAYALAREMGFDNINMDTIIGLPGEGIDEVRYTMEELAKLQPENITVHSLALKRAARLSMQKDQYRGIAFHSSDQIMDLTRQICEENGLYPYYLYRQKNMAGNFENVGYAKPGKEGLYNILIMEEVQSILALGAGASTKLVEADGLIERIENVKDISNYIDRIDEMIRRKQVIPGKVRRNAD